MLSTIYSWTTIWTKLGFQRKQRSNRRAGYARPMRLELVEDRRMLAILTVNSFADTHIDTDGVLSLREAIEVVQQGNTSGLDATTIANQISGPLGSNDTIRFASNLNGDTITLNLAFGQISFSKSLTIDASLLSNGITINGNDPTPGHTGQGIRIFNITDATNGTNPSMVTLVGLTLKGGDVGGFPAQGGAIRTEGRLILRDCVLKQNQADFGGAIFVQVAGGGATPREVLRIENSIIDDNFATTGGGIAIVSGVAGAVSDTVFISGTSITDNRANFGNGGGLYADLFGADLTIVDSTIAHNEASRGGGIYANLNGTGSRTASLTILDSTLEENDASTGGGIFADINGASLLRVEGSTFHDNEVNGNGGGIKANLSNASRFELLGTTFVENDGGNGGGLHADLSTQSRVEVANSTFDGNETSSGHGGGMYVRPDGGSVVEVDGSSFLHNDAAGRGGGFYSEAFNGSSLVLRELTVEDNDAASGGGIYVDIHTATVEIDQSSIALNRVTGFGGGIHLTVRTDASASIAGSTVANNIAAANTGPGGGGISSQIDQNAELTIADSTISGNIAQNGGGVEVDMPGFNHNQANGSRFKMERSVVQGNRAVDRGGGILTATGSGGKVDIVDSVISGNDAGITLANVSQHPLSRLANAGGGIYCYLFSNENPAVLTIAGTEISQNTSGQHGGGLAVFSKREHLEAAISRVSVYNTTISGNVAGHTTVANNPGTGGGVHLAIWNAVDDEGEEALDARFQNATITNNVADQGGGVYSLRPDHALRRSDTRLTNSIASANRKHNGTASKLHGSFNIAETVFNVIGPSGAGNSTFNHVTHAVQALSGQNIFTDSPLLGPLGQHGGPTRTHRPLVGSPTIDAGDNNRSDIPFTSTQLVTDQRGSGFTRRVDIPGVGPTGVAVVDIGAVEFQFLPGDYNRDETVDAADYTIWRDTLGSMTDLRADGDGNGVINQNDYVIWKNAFGLRTGTVFGDASGSGAVDFADYLVWSSTYGSTSDLRADFNEDGIVDDADYSIWFDVFGSTMEIAHFGLLWGVFDPDAPPAVVGFALSFPGDNAVDFAGRVGSGEQLRSVPLTAATTLSITFSQDVVVTQGALAITNLDGTSPTVTSFAYDPAAQTATWTFAAALADGRYVVQLSDTVENLDGKALDGEFFNPTKLSDTGTAFFPSGDGDAGGEFRFRFTVLVGDDNHDNIYGTTDYQNWHSTEPGMIIVSTTADDYDSDLSFGDVSLREAVNYANTAGTPMAIQLPAGRYTLSRTGTESSANVGVNDLDITGNIAIIGAGPGLSIIDNSGLASAPAADSRAFNLSSTTNRLKLSRLTVANGSSSTSGQVASVSGGASLEVVDCAVVNHTAYIGGAAISVSSANLVVSRSVFSNDDVTGTYGGAAISVYGTVAAPASVTVGESIFAQNVQPGYGRYYPSTYNGILISGTVTKTNRGKNLYDYAGGGFFDTTPGVGDYLGTPTYIVTSVADTFNHADDLEALSLREAVDLANQASGPQTIWVPAWRFVLTRGRGTNATDTSVAYGDLDVKNSMTIRGVQGRTSIAWKPGVIDKVFDLIGDFNNDGQADYGSVSSADYTIWQNQNGSSGAWEQYSADADDDGDVDEDDYDLWVANFGHTLTLAGIGL